MSNNSKKEKTVQCPHCDKKFLDSRGLVPHVNYVHLGIEWKGGSTSGMRWTFEKIKCEICGKELSPTQLNSHVGAKTCNPNTKKSTSIEIYRIEGTDDYKCPICGKIRPKKGIGFHVWKHAEGKDHKPGKGRKAWNKGLKKDDHPSLKQQGETYKSRGHKSWSLGKNKLSDPKVAQMSSSIRETVKNKIVQDDWHFYPRTAKVGKYSGEKFHSGWEIKFAEWLDSHGIEWVRTRDSFPYEWNGSTHNYFPDFYLPLADVYVEIKGVAVERDYCKWTALKNLVVLTGEDLRGAKII